MTVHLDASTSPAWLRLMELSAEPQPTIAELFAADAQRGRDFVASGGGLTLDFSRQRLGVMEFELLLQIPDDVGLRARIAGMYDGDLANPTEGRQVLHTALRRPNAPHRDLVRTERQRMLEFAEGVRRGGLTGSSNEPFELVVNIGIGGSDLGPSMAVEALRRYSTGAPSIAFVSNVDGCRLADVFARANPARTLFIVCSKTFTTSETSVNAEAARKWVVQWLGTDAVPTHFAAVSANTSAMDAFGLHPDYRFAMWDWVGGRYSIWSSIGVSLAISIGAAQFERFLAGAAAMDDHFLSAPWAGNVPALLGLLGIWNINFLKVPTLAVLPYDDRLARFPAYLQQLDMESNGKQVRGDGSPAFCETAPVIWGEPGNNAQHSFFQMLHQGTPLTALDFLLPASSSCGDQGAHDLAIANCLAQAEAFAFGHPAENPHKRHAGDRPSNLLLFRQLDPATLGALMALYEHKIFTQSVVWGVNAFDQWGVELGKQMAKATLQLVKGAGRASSASLARSLALLRELRRD